MKIWFTKGDGAVCAGKMTETILIVEDDTDISMLLKTILEEAGYQTVQAFSGTEAQLLLEKSLPSLILLDLMLPGMSGETLLQWLRGEQQCQIPVLILSAKNAVRDKVAMLHIGADDYITKPFEPEEVTARVQAVLRRSSVTDDRRNTTEVWSYKRLKLYPDLRKVTVAEQELVLTGKEYDILRLMMENPEKVYSRERLYELIWKEGYYGADHTINVHVSNLRKKITACDPDNAYIQSVYGIGFRLAKN